MKRPLVYKIIRRAYLLIPMNEMIHYKNDRDKEKTYASFFPERKNNIRRMVSADL